MPVFEYTASAISPLERTTFAELGIHETRDIQRLLKDNISIVSDDILVIAEEFCEWEDSKRRIDLLAIDRDANLVVIELKRTEDGGHMELQALRYAAMVSEMTFEHACNVYQKHLDKISDGGDSASELLDFLGWSHPSEDDFAQNVKIILASAEFSKELTTTVLWLLERDIDICCVRLHPYKSDNRIFLDIQQIIPLPEAAEFQVRAREKAQRERKSRERGADYTRYDIRLGDYEFLSEPKRKVIFETFRHLVRLGYAPEDVVQHCGPRRDRCLVSVAGELDCPAFIEAARDLRRSKGKSFDPKRFFCKDGELIDFEGRTYAFSSQWGGSDWLSAMTELRDTYPDARIRFSPSEK